MMIISRLVLENSVSVMDALAMKISPADAKDIESIITIRTAAFSHYAPQAYTPAQVATLLDDYKIAEFEAMIADCQIFVCKSGGATLGTAGWKDENVRHVYVRPDLSKQGIGTSLLSHVEGDYRARTQKPFIRAGVILYARNFYEKNGFRVISRERDWDGSEYYQMQKNF